MFDALRIAAADTERDHARDVADDLADALLNCRKRRVEAYRHVAAADVEADAGNADLAFIGDHASDRLRIAEMPVGADRAGDHVPDAHAIAHLRERTFGVLTEDLERTVLILRSLRRQLDGGGFLDQMLLPRGIAEPAPQRHATSLADAVIRI